MSKNNDLLPVIQQEVETQEQQITALVVKDEASLADASDRIKVIKDLKKKLETEEELFTAPAKEIISAAKAKYGPLTKALAAMEKVLKDKAQAFMLKRDAENTNKVDKLGERVAKGTMKADTAVRKMEAIPDATKARGASSGLQVIKRKDVEAMPIGHMPPESLKELAGNGYILWDMVKIRKDALAGVIIPGVKVVEVASTRSVW